MGGKNSEIEELWAALKDAEKEAKELKQVVAGQHIKIKLLEEKNVIKQ